MATPVFSYKGRITGSFLLYVFNTDKSAGTQEKGNSKIYKRNEQ